MPKKPAKSKLRPGVKVRETSDGPTYHTVVNLGTDPLTGKRKQQRVTAATPEELDEKIVQARREFASGTHRRIDTTTTVADFLAEWLESVSGTVKGGTMRAWRSRCAVWITPIVGERKLRELAPSDVDRLMRRIITEGRSPSYAHAVHATLRTALNHAIRWQLIERNPCGAVRAPRMETPEMHTWTAEQAAHAIAVSAQDTRYGALWRLALTTGMRSGELLGLRWHDVDFDRGAIAVRQTVARGQDGELEVSTPKTTRSRRAIAIGADDVAALRVHRTHQLHARLEALEWTDHDLVFPNPTGGPTHPSSLSNAFRRLVAASGLPMIRIHDLRHTAATLMLASGEHPKIVSERLGHSSIAITMDRYSHVSIDMQRDAADRLEALLKRASTAHR